MSGGDGEHWSEKSSRRFSICSSDPRIFVCISISPCIINQIIWRLFATRGVWVWVNKSLWHLSVDQREVEAWSDVKSSEGETQRKLGVVDKNWRRKMANIFLQAIMSAALCVKRNIYWYRRWWQWWQDLDLIAIFKCFEKSEQVCFYLVCIR